MRLLAAVGPGILVAGLVVLALAVARGEASLFLVVVVPVVTGSGPLALVGILLVFAGFFVSFLGWPARAAMPATDDLATAGQPAERPVPPSRRWGGVVFLGPLPLVFGSDPRMTRSMILVGVVLFLALLALTVLALLA